MLLVAVILFLVRLPSSTAQIPEFGIYTSSLCLAQATEIDWGTSKPGDIVNRTVFVRNNEAASISRLTLSTQNFSPIGSQSDLFLTSAPIAVAINQDSVEPLTLSLKISDSIQNIQKFSFDITITAEYAGDGGGTISPRSTPSQTLRSNPAPDYSQLVLIVIAAAGAYLVLGGARKR